MGGGPGKEKHKVEADGILGDGVSHYPATVQDMQQFAAASESLSKMQTPVLHDAKNPASRMFVASFDGTGNDAINDPEHETNVARTHREIAARNQQGDTNIISRYVSGPGTQEGFSRVLGTVHVAIRTTNVWRPCMRCSSSRQRSGRMKTRMR